MKILVFVDGYHIKWRKRLVIRRTRSEENLAARYWKTKNSNVIYIWAVMSTKFYMFCSVRQLDIIVTRELDDCSSDFNIRQYRDYGYNAMQYDATTYPCCQRGMYNLGIIHQDEIEKRLHKYNGTLEIIR